jgi:hypothetical protein
MLSRLQSQIANGSTSLKSFYIELACALGGILAPSEKRVELGGPTPFTGTLVLAIQLPDISLSSKLVYF